MSRINKISRRLQVARLRMKASGGALDRVFAALLKALIGVFDNFTVTLSLATGLLFAFLVSKKDDILWQAIDKLTDENLKKIILMLIYPAANWALLWFAAFSAPRQHVPAVLFLTAGLCWIHRFTSVDWATLLVGFLLRLVFVSKGEAKRYVILGLLAVVMYYWYVGKLPILRGKRATVETLQQRRSNCHTYDPKVWADVEPRDFPLKGASCERSDGKVWSDCHDDQGDLVPLDQLRCPMTKNAKGVATQTRFWLSPWGEWCTCKPQRGAPTCLPPLDAVGG